MHTITVDNDQIIRAEFSGKESKEELNVALQKIDTMIDEMHQKRLKGLVYCKILDNYSIDMETRLVGVQWSRNARFDRMAIQPSSETFARVINFVLTATDQNDRIQIFLNEESATSWLKL